VEKDKVQLDFTGLNFNKTYDATTGAALVIAGDNNVIAGSDPQSPGLTGFSVAGDSAKVEISDLAVTYAFQTATAGTGKTVTQTGAYTLATKGAGPDLTYTNYEIDTSYTLPKGDIAKATPTWDTSVTSGDSITYGMQLKDAEKSAWGVIDFDGVTGKITFTNATTMPDIVGASGSTAPTDSKYEATFTPTGADAENYEPITKMLYVEVGKATPTLASASDLPTGTMLTVEDDPLSGSEFVGGKLTFEKAGVTTSISGAWSWTGNAAALAETFDAGGWYYRPATFTPSDTSRFENFTTTASNTDPVQDEPVSSASPRFRVASPGTVVITAPTVSGSAKFGQTIAQAVAAGDITLETAGALSQEKGNESHTLTGTYEFTSTSTVLAPDMSEGNTVEVSVTFTPDSGQWDEDPEHPYYPTTCKVLISV
jgi:hypothetical protein